MKKTLITVLFFILTMQGYSQKCLTVNEYKTIIDGQEMIVLLYSDFTYDFRTYWGTYHGLWEIFENEEDSLFDKIYFYDDTFTTKNAFYSTHISIPDTMANDTDSLNNDTKCRYVTMYDLTGVCIPCDNVCFLDSDNNIIECRDYPDKTSTRQSIPSNTRNIGMIGEYGNYSTYFKCNYSSIEGNIAFIIGPSVGRFYISKERDVIKYRPCRCNTHTVNCSVSFEEKRNR